MKLRTIVTLSLVGALLSAPVMHAANEAAQAPQPSRWRSMWNGAGSAISSFFNPAAHVDFDDDVQPQPNPAQENLAQDNVAQDNPAAHNDDERPFSARVHDFANNRYARVAQFINENRQRAGQAINERVNNARTAVREKIREEFRGAVQEEINDLRNNPQRQEEIIAGARNIAAGFVNSPAGQRLRDEAVNAARAQIPNVLNGIKEEIKKPENAKAFEDMADQFMNGSHQGSIFERIKNSFMDSTRSVRWGLTSLGVLGSIVFAYKIGTWIKNKFWGEPVDNENDEIAGNQPQDSREALRNRVQNAQPEIFGKQSATFLSANDKAQVTQAIGHHQAFLKNQKLSGKVRALAQGQLEVLQRASNNQNALANLKVDLGNLDMALAK